MTDELVPLEEQITTFLAICDDALASGADPTLTFGAETPAELRTRMQSNLQTMRRLRRHIARSAPGVPADDGDPFTAAAEPPFARLGRFLIRRELGRGAHGLVFLAYDPGLCREVALKVGHGAALLAAAQRERFLREARAAAALDHPNVVPIYEAGEVGPVCYIAAAYCPGGTLADWLRQHGPQSGTAAAELIATLADAVQYAHDRGVLHRDLKPSNILLQEAPRPAALGWTLLPRVTDFGTAAAIAADDTPGGIVGTPSYMAPEQASGAAATVGPAADVYALGAILYELLTGRPPFEGEAVYTVLEQVKTQAPVPPSRRQPTVAPALDAICLKCLHKDPAQRYVSAAALGAALQAFLRTEVPTHTTARGTYFMKLGVLLAGFIGVAALQAPPAQRSVVGGMAPVPAPELPARATFPLTLRGHAANVTGVAFSPDGRRLASASMRGVKLWDLTGGREARTLADSTGEFMSIAYSPDGNAIAAGMVYSRARIWDCRTGEITMEQRLPGETRGLAYRQGGKQLVSACTNWTGPDFQTTRGDLRLWNPLNGASIRSFHTHHERGMFALALSPDDRLLACTLNRWDIPKQNVYDGEMQIWDMNAGRHLRSLHDPAAFDHVAFSPDSRRIAASLMDGSIRIWDVTNGEPLLMITHPARRGYAVAFSPNGAHLVSGAADGCVRLWDAHSGKQRRCRRRHLGPVGAIVFSADGRCLASGGTDGLVKVWHVTADDAG